MIWRSAPGLAINLSDRAAHERQAVRQNSTEVGGVALNRRPDLVCMRRLPCLIARSGVGRNQHGQNWRMVTGLMKVLQVECVVPGLFDIRAAILALAALELEREDRGARDDDGIDAAAEARDIELEVEPAGQPGEGSAEDLNLIFPGALLFGVQVAVVGGGKTTEDFCPAHREESGDIGGKVSRVAPDCVRQREQDTRRLRQLGL